MRLLYGLDGKGEYTVEQVGSMMQVSGSRVKQIKSSAMRKIRRDIPNIEG